METPERKRGPKPQPPKPTPLKGAPEPPDGLDEGAAAHWRATLAMIDAAGMLSTLDRDALTVYVNIWKTWRDAKAKVDRPASEGGGLAWNTDRGVKPSPWYVIMREAQRDMTKYLDRFGLTPLGRSKLKIDGGQPGEEKWAGFGVVGER